MFSLTGIKEASVFPGYCSAHDASLFAAIEKQALRIDDPEQAYCLFLRAFSYEYTKKRWALSGMRILMDEARTRGLSFDSDYVEFANTGREQFLEIDAPFYFGEAFRKDRIPITEWLRWSWRVIPRCLGASCTSCFSPLQEQYETYAIAYQGEPQPLVTFSLIPQPVETHVVLCWHHQHTDLVQPLEKRLHSDDDLELEAFINECAFAESEDTCINPDLWENISEQERLDALNAMQPEFCRGKIEKVPRLIKL
ncbi:MAG: hypothetical protein JRC92_08055 [Deltaproteobacteria bacterium]|nr:hypothetical protein [Deltaproteobacteria bacterium]